MENGQMKPGNTISRLKITINIGDEGTSINMEGVVNNALLIRAYYELEFTQTQLMKRISNSLVEVTENDIL